jgi:hypothetical protein
VPSSERRIMDHGCRGAQREETSGPITDRFLVYVESDTVNRIHRVLLFEIAESAAVNSGC